MLTPRGKGWWRKRGGFGRREAGPGKGEASGAMLSASGFPAGRAPLGPGPVHAEGPQHPEGAAGGGAGGTPEGAEEVSHLEGRPSLEPGGEGRGAWGPFSGPGAPPRLHGKSERSRASFQSHVLTPPAAGAQPAGPQPRPKREDRGSHRGWVGGRGGKAAPSHDLVPASHPSAPVCPPPHPSCPRRCGGAASCITVTAAPVSTGRAPRSCCWRCCCCWAATGASRPAGTWLLPSLSYPGLWAFPLLPQPSLPSHLRHPRGDGLLPRSCPHSRRLSCVGILVPWLVGGGTRLDTLAGELGGL